jgi:uncharacterized damage-inducible protein DinB
MSIPAGELAAALREACVAALQEAYEEAGLRGLCHEGRWEYALDAVRQLDLTLYASPPDMADLPRRWAYEVWATERVLARLEALPAVPEQALRWLAHLLGAQEVWITRIGGASSRDLAVWPSWTLPECRAAAARLQPRYDALLADLAAGRDTLERAVTYSNQAGTATFTNRLGDLLNHALLHGHYHRGQIATALRQAGHDPAATDYILFAR